MTNPARIVQHTALNFISIIIVAVSTFFATVVVARFLGPEMMGVYSYAFWALEVVAVFVNLGFVNAVTKFTAEYDEQKNAHAVSGLLRYVFRIEFLLALLGVLALLSLSFAAPHVLNEQVRSPLMIVAVLVLPFAFMNILIGVFRGLHKYRHLARVHAFVYPLHFVAILAALIFGYGLQALLAIHAVTYTVVCVLYLVLLVRDGVLTRRAVFSSERKAKFLQYSSILSLIIVMDMVVWQRSEVFFLSIFSTAENIAFYSIPFTLSTAIVLYLPGAFLILLLPFFSRIYEHGNPDEMKGTFLLSLRYMMMLAIPLAIGVMVLAEPIILLIYGNAYVPAIPILRILILSSTFGMIGAVGSSMLLGANRQVDLLKLSIVAAVLNIILDIVLIQRFGLFGAAFANAGVQVIFVIVLFIFIARSLQIHFPLGMFWKFVWAALAMGVVLLPFVPLPPIIRLGASVIVGVPAYIVLLVFFRIATRGDIDRFSALDSILPEFLRQPYRALIHFMKKYIVQEEK